MKVTSRPTETQTLIADIDRLLSNKRLSKLFFNQPSEPRQVLERIREFLVRVSESDVQLSSAENQHSQQPQLSPLLAKFVDQGDDRQSLPQQDELKQEEGANVGAGQENNLFSALLAPLQAELQALLQERATLVQEIRQLEQRRLHNYSLAQQLANQEQMISEFLQVLMSRLVPNNTPQMVDLATSPKPQLLKTDDNKNAINNSNTEQASSQQFEEPVDSRLIQKTNWGGGINSPWTVSPAPETSLELSSIQPFLNSSDQVERLTKLTKDLDQRLLALDGTVNVVFEAIQRNIHTYHESLSQALARMYSKGVQGEQWLVSWINNLTSQLQQQTDANEPSIADAKSETLPLGSKAQEDTATTLHLDAVLPQLHQDSSKLIPDEVDQLYASLFGADDLTDLSLDISPNLVINVTDELPVDVTTSPPLLNPADTSTATATNQVQPVAPIDAIEVRDVTDAAPSTDTPLESATNQQQQAVIMPDPWFDEPDAGLLDRSIPNAKATEQSSQPQENIEASRLSDAAPSLSVQPSLADTITTLTNILADVVLEVLPPVNPASIAPANQDTAVSPMVTTVGETTFVVDQSLDNYIPASSTENLLSLEENLQATGVPDISLEEAQLQQLEQDLANFDGELNSQLQLITNLENQEKTETGYSPPKVPQQAGEIVAKIEKKTEIETSLHQSSKLREPTLGLISISNSTNNTEALNTVNSVWYLGIDLGTTGISAALLNRSTTEVYPLYWSAQNQSEATSQARTFRFPAEVYLPTASLRVGETESKEAIEQTSPSVVAEEIPNNPATTLTQNLFSAQLKPYLQVAIPYKSEQQKWEPVLQLNEFSTVPLVWVVRSLSKLLLTLMSDRNSTTLGLTAAAVGLDQQTFRNIISNITGVICSCPSDWSEQYRFNLREALLISKLVQHPQQVFFVEEAIASLLSELDGANGEKVKLNSSEGSRPAKTSDHPLFGNTLIINIGAGATEMALVDLPENLEDLTHNDFMLHSFAYAGKGIDQDIICQLLFPPKWRQLRNGKHDSENITSKPWQWQPAIPGLERMHLSSLGWEELNLPRPGEPDITDRIRLQQRLESSVLGKAVLDAAIALKLILQHQESFTLELADQQWVLHRRDLESQVFVPFVRRLNRELNRLLVAKGIPTEAINQAILTGGVASLGAVSRWLRQKLPNAKMIQDLYLDENGLTCSRVAYGLAMLPLHPQVLEVPRQQYTDYFLLTELLRLLPDQPLSFGEVIQLFEGRGINTRSCQQRLLAFLESELPPGLIPSVLESSWLTQNSLENSDYQAIAAAPLFEKQGSLTYRPNFQQLRSLHRYLDAIKASTKQSLEEPYTVNFALAVSQ